MDDRPEPDTGEVGFPHRVLDRLTAITLLVGSLRTSLQDDPVSPEKIEEVLVRIEQELTATATLAHDMQARTVQAEERKDRQ